MILKYGLSVQAIPGHINQNMFCSHALGRLYEKRPTYSRTTGIIFTALAHKYGLIQLDVLSLMPRDDPPWLLPHSQMNLEMTRIVSLDVSHQEIQQRFLELVDAYNAHVRIFTDGSKTNEGVGCAFFVDGESHSRRLPEYASVYTAELIAIQQALRFVDHYGIAKSLICTDCLSAVTAISNSFSHDTLIIHIMSTLFQLHKEGKQVTFVWTPRHCGMRHCAIAVMKLPIKQLEELPIPT